MGSHSLDAVLVMHGLSTTIGRSTSSTSNTCNASAGNVSAEVVQFIAYDTVGTTSMDIVGYSSINSVANTSANNVLHSSTISVDIHLPISRYFSSGKVGCGLSVQFRLMRCLSNLVGWLQDVPIPQLMCRCTDTSIFQPYLWHIVTLGMHRKSELLTSAALTSSALGNLHRVTSILLWDSLQPNKRDEEAFSIGNPVWNSWCSYFFQTQPVGTGGLSYANMVSSGMELDWYAALDYQIFAIIQCFGIIKVSPYPIAG